MALKTAKYSDIPKGELTLSKSEAVEFQLDLMETLCPETKRFFVSHGRTITSISCAATCVYLHTYYRRSVNVLYHGRFFSFVPAVMLPGVLNLGLHKLLITDNILVQKWACPTCYHMRSALLSLSCGIIYPAIVAPLVGFSYARRTKSFDVPPVNSKKILKFWFDLTKPISRRLGIFACVQLLIGATIAEMETRENNSFNQNINRYINEYVEREAREKARLKGDDTKQI